MQEKNRGCIVGTRFPIENIEATDGNSSIVSRRRQFIDRGGAHQTHLFYVAALAGGRSALSGAAVMGTGSSRPRMSRLIVRMIIAVIARLPMINSQGASAPTTPVSPRASSFKAAVGKAAAPKLNAHHAGVGPAAHNQGAMRTRIKACNNAYPTNPWTRRSGPLPVTLR